MFQAPAKPTRARGLFGMAELIYHSVVRDIRRSHRNAMIGLLLNMMQAFVFVLAFFVLFELLGMRQSALRGDFLLYIMSGIFLYLTHIKTVGAVLMSEGPASPMMQHAPMNTIIAICAAALSSLYIQLLSMAVILFVYHIAVTPITIDAPVGAMGMVLLAWFSGLAVGVIFLAIKPWAPDFVGLASTIYSRANMIASGKMFVANTLPAHMIAVFDWNPLFHIIDQTRGFVFLHYNPHFTSISYPIYLSLVLLLIGLMGEFYTRRNASASWNATR
ncbi:ABC transporter permease [Yoonia sp.]|uniref:ABC transporter permease n=1 Tax=Yoonia sp. TaxID=2212373 RepID=UPI003F6AA1BA